LPFRGEVFEGVFAFTLLQNMPKPSQTLSELKRIAAGGGWVVVTGLKKAFALEKFLEVLEGSGLRLVDFVDDADVNCYVAVLAAA
jgi:ubiquinone/menaquinone biosynthesis C-methylase UbiE